MFSFKAGFDLSVLEAASFPGCAMASMTAHSWPFELAAFHPLNTRRICSYCGQRSNSAYSISQSCANVGALSLVHSTWTPGLRLARAQAPRSGAAADLHLARSRELELVELLRRKVGRGDEEGELALVVLVAQQEVPALREVTAQVSRRLADELEASVVPGHAREARTVKEVLARLRQVAPLGDALVGIVLTRPDVSFSTVLSRRTKEVLGAGIGAGALVVVGIDVVYENVSRGIVTSEAEIEAARGRNGKRCPHGASRA